MITHIKFSDHKDWLTDFPYYINIGEISNDFKLHTHDFSELFIILGGDAIHLVDDYSYSVTAGDVYVIKEKTVHGFTKVNHLTICNIMLKGNSLTSQYSDLKNMPGYQALFVLEPYYRKEQQFSNRLHLDYSSLKQVIPIINALKTEYQERMDGFKSMFLSYLLNLVIYLSRVYVQGMNDSNGKLLDIANAISYMETNYYRKITLDELSKMSGMSARNFDRIFKQNYGSSPISYLLKLRIDKAASMLRDTDMSITEIALDRGFNDSTYFSRQFKALTGVTPKMYRKYNKK